VNFQIETFKTQLKPSLWLFYSALQGEPWYSSWVLAERGANQSGARLHWGTNGALERRRCRRAVCTLRVSSLRGSNTSGIGGKPESLGQARNDAFDPMYGPAVRRKRLRRDDGGGLASMYPAFDWSVFAPGHHGYQRACDLISGQASTGPFGSPVLACAGKTEPPSLLILSQTSAGKSYRSGYVIAGS